MEITESKCLRSGQPRPYADSIYEYDVTTTPGTSDEAWELCQSLCIAKNRRDGASHDGACGFPFGLQSYGSLRKLNEHGTKWNYRVTSPYCD